MKGLGTRQHPEQNMLREEVWFGGSHRLLEIFSFFFDWLLCWLCLVRRRLIEKSSKSKKLIPSGAGVMSDALVERRIYQLDLVVNTSTWWYMRSVTRLVFGTSKVVRTEIVTSGYWNRIYCQVSVGTSLLLYEGSDVIRRTMSLTVCLCLCLCLPVRLFVNRSVCLSIRLSVRPYAYLLNVSTSF